MVKSPANKHIIKVSVTFQNIYNTTDTQVYNFTNQAIPDGSLNYFPLLISAGSWGVSSLNAIPETVDTEVTIDNSRGSLGFDRRVSDLFKKYVIHNQAVTLSYAYVDPDSTSTVTFTEMWSAKAIAWSVAIGNPDTLTIQISSVGIPQRKMTRTLRADDFTYIPDGSVGYDLPLIFGGHDPNVADDGVESIYIRPICCSVNANECEYAYATTFANSFKQETITGGASTSVVHFKNSAMSQQGKEVIEWSRVRLITSGSESTPAFSSGGSVAAVVNPYWDYPNGFSAYGEELTTASNNYLITGAKVKFLGTGDSNYLSSIPSGEETDYKLRVGIFIDDFSGVPKTEIAFGEADWFDYLTELRGATNTSFDVQVKFNNLAHIGGITGMKYFIIMSQTTSNATEPTLTYDLAVQASRSGSSQVVYGKTNDFEIDTDGDTIGDVAVGSDQFVRVYNRTNTAPIWSVYGLAFSHNTSKLYSADTDGLGMATIYFVYYDNQAAATGPDLSNLDMLFEVTGLQDDASGTITGSANSTIKEPHHVISLLGLNYDTDYPTVWGGSGYADRWLTLDNSAYDYTNPTDNITPNPFYRTANGYIEGPINLDELLANFCREMGAKVIRRTNTTEAERYSVWLFGGTKDSAATFTDENSRIISIECLGFETVVNNVKFYYKRDARQLDLLKAAQAQQFRDYTKLLDLKYFTSAEATQITARSYYNFGHRANEIADYNLINDTQSAYFVFRMLAGQYGFPNWYITIETPYIEFYNIEAQQNVELLHVDFPAYFGTSPNPSMISYNGSTVDISPEVYPKRAERQRCIVEGKEINFDSNGAPYIRFTLRALVNSPYEPT